MKLALLNSISVFWVGSFWKCSDLTPREGGSEIFWGQFTLELFTQHPEVISFSGYESCPSPPQKILSLCFLYVCNLWEWLWGPLLWLSELSCCLQHWKLVNGHWFKSWMLCTWSSLLLMCLSEQQEAVQVLGPYLYVEDPAETPSWPNSGCCCHLRHESAKIPSCLALWPHISNKFSFPSPPFKER